MRDGKVGRVRSDGSVAIYALLDADDAPRYVGKTSYYLTIRHKGHIWQAKRDARLPVSRWLRKQIDRGDRLCIKLLEYVPAGEDWAAREKHWIAKFRNEGMRLLNLTDGGEGLTGHARTDEQKQKIAAKRRTGSFFNCEVCSTRFWRKLKDIKLGHNRFCSRRCSNARHKGRSLFHGA